MSNQPFSSLASLSYTRVIRVQYSFDSKRNSFMSENQNKKMFENTQINNQRKSMAQKSCFPDQQQSTSYKKIQLLEQRDKILRKYRVKSTDTKPPSFPRYTEIGPAKERSRKEIRNDIDLEELKSLIGQQAISTHDKYQLLNQRDKILRKYNVKVNDVNQAAVFRGTCPDMCPEKERYRREVQKLLHPYETLNSQQGIVDHNRAVKDYSRSSADQEEPLPHELRPVAVLEHTMNYLVGSVAYHEPNDESQLQVWYDFLWNRTRAIRKDITQQMLNDSAAVCLIEKCVRFHIYAGYRLCELDMNEFDQKFNTEHLTKCLLSLRHMYDDLNKTDFECPNEAEFRCYYVLLNLNDSNVLRQVLTFKQSVRQSLELRFALKLFSAMQNKNYVQFFRLVRENATYLQASLAHRYFNNVRVEALRILVKSYIDRTQFPITDLVKLLCFENVEDAVSFCSSFGLMNVDNNFIILNKSYFAEPEQDPALKRSKNFVEGKQLAPIGEIFNGCSIPSIVCPPPVISFDGDHRYVNDPVVKPFLDILKEESYSEPTTLSAFVVQVPRKTDVFLLNDHPRKTDVNLLNEQSLTVAAKNLLASVVHQMIAKTASDVLSERFANYFLTSCVGDILKRTVQDVFADQKRITDEKVKRKKEAAFRLTNLASEILDDSLNSFCDEEVSNVVKNELRIAKWKYEDKIRNYLYSISYDLRTELLNEFLDDELPFIIRRYYEYEVSLKLNALDKIRKNLTLINVRKCFDHWLRKTRRKKHNRILLDDFPLYPGSKYNSYMNADGSTPPKKIRLTTYHDCPTTDCCKLAQNEGVAEGNCASTNGVLKGNEDTLVIHSKEHIESATREIQTLLDSLKRGIEKEKLALYPSKSVLKS